MTAWLLVGGVVLSTACADLLQAHGMRRGGARWKIPLSIFFMAVSFFSFTRLLRIADLSFSVPATALSFVVETFLAKLVLNENVTARRWAGALLAAFGAALLSH